MNNNEKLPMMKRLLLVWVMVFGLGMPGWGQGVVDYAGFEVLGRRGDVTMVVKDNDYRMVVGKLKKPGAVFLLGYSREQARQRMEIFLREIGKELESDKLHQVVFCGTRMTFTTSGTGEKTVYKFQSEDKKGLFTLSKNDIDELSAMVGSN